MMAGWFGGRGSESRGGHGGAPGVGYERNALRHALKEVE